MKKYLWFGLGLIITAALLWPLAAAPYFSMHDDVQTIRLYEMNKCILDGQIPCRWVPDLGGLYGYPLFNYYAPLPYYIGEVFYLLSGSLLFSAKVMFALSFLGSYIFMYLLGKKLWGEKGGALSAIFYSLAPYHSVVFYVRGAMGEMWGLMFYPAILWSILRLKEAPKITNLLLLSVFTALLFLSHNLSTMLFLPISLAFIGLLYYQSKDLRFIKFSLAALALGLALSAFYTVPMVAEKNLVHVETTVEGYFSYTEHFKGLKKLFLDRSWGWGASVREYPGSEKDGMSFQIGWVHLFGWVLALFTARKLWKTKKEASLLIIFSSLMITLSVFMVHPRSEFIWKLIDPLKYLQFPWRFLMIIIFFVSLVSGSIFLWLDKRKQLLVWIGLTVLVAGLNFSYFRPEKFLQVTDQQLLTGQNWDKEIKRSIFDFLPIYAQEPPAELEPARYQVIVGDSAVENYREGTDWFNFQTETSTHTILRLSKYYFPDWKVLVDGKEITIDYKNNHLGLISVILGPGTHTVSGRLYNTPVRSLGNLVTVLGLMAYFLLLLSRVPKIRRWTSYYLGGLYR